MAPSNQRTIRTGRLLIALARTGQVLTVLGTLALVYVMFRIAQPWHPDFPEFLLRLFGEPALALVNGWGALRALAYLWALERMRRIGTALLHHGPISTEVADAVRQSARALLLCGFSVLLQLDLPRNDPPASVAVNHLPSWEFNWMAFYAVCLLGVCVLAIAHILQAAVELKAENEGFV